MIHVSKELEGESVYATYTPDISISVEPSLVSLSDRLRQVRRRCHPGSTRPRSQIDLIYFIGRIEERVALGVSPKRIQLVGAGVVGHTEV
jgi:hypothetical protein